MAMGAMSASAILGRLGGWAPCLGQTRNTSVAADSGAAWSGDWALPTAARAAPTHWQLEGTSVKTRSRNSPVWPGSKVVGMMTKRPSGWSVRRKTLRELM